MCFSTARSNHPHEKRAHTIKCSKYIPLSALTSSKSRNIIRSSIQWVETRESKTLMEWVGSFSHNEKHFLLPDFPKWGKLKKIVGSFERVDLIYFESTCHPVKVLQEINKNSRWISQILMRISKDFLRKYLRFDFFFLLRLQCLPEVTRNNPKAT